MVRGESFKEHLKEMKSLNLSSKRSVLLLLSSSPFTLHCQVAESLAVFCINICRLVDPEVIIFGGGMAHAGDTLIKSIEEAMARHTWTVYPPTVKLEVAHQVGDAGMLGAALAAQSLYSHLHPSVSHHEDLTGERPSSSPVIPAPLITRERALFGTITAGLLFLLLSKSPSPSLDSATATTLTSSRNIFLFSHAVLVGVHLFGLCRSSTATPSH
jgi:hypothetical protein